MTWRPYSPRPCPRVSPRTLDSREVWGGRHSDLQEGRVLETRLGLLDLLLPRKEGLAVPQGGPAKRKENRGPHCGDFAEGCVSFDVRVPSLDRQG